MNQTEWVAAETRLWKEMQVTAVIPRSMRHAAKCGSPERRKAALKEIDRRRQAAFAAGWRAYRDLIAHEPPG